MANSLEPYKTVIDPKKLNPLTLQALKFINFKSVERRDSPQKGQELGKMVNLKLENIQERPQKVDQMNLIE